MKQDQKSEFLNFCVTMIVRLRYLKSANPEDWVLRFSQVSTRLISTNLGTNHINSGDSVIRYCDQDVRGMSFDDFQAVVNNPRIGPGRMVTVIILNNGIDDSNLERGKEVRPILLPYFLITLLTHIKKGTYLE